MLLNLGPVVECARSFVSVRAAVPDAGPILVGDRASNPPLDGPNAQVLLTCVNRERSISLHLFGSEATAEFSVYIVADRLPNLKTTKSHVGQISIANRIVITLRFHLDQSINKHFLQR